MNHLGIRFSFAAVHQLVAHEIVRELPMDLRSTHWEYERRRKQNLRRQIRKARELC